MFLYGGVLVVLAVGLFVWLIGRRRKGLVSGADSTERHLVREIVLQSMREQNKLVDELIKRMHERRERIIVEAVATRV
jgi:hypothetical protein